VSVSSGAVPLLLTPLPDPDVPFAPEGIFHGSASVTGDNSGGVAVLFLTPAKGIEHMYVFDSMAVDSSTGEPNDLLITYTLYMGEGQDSVDAHYRSAGVFNSAHGRRYPIDELRPPKAIIGIRRSQDPGTSLIAVNFESNVNTLQYNLVVQGRYYRRSEMNKPGFYKAVLG